jgi:hypothetical protein
MMETLAMVEMDLLIDAALQNLLPPLTDEELHGLEEDIVKDGRVISPVLYWHDDELDRNVVVDGMHRLPIAKACGVPYRTEPMTFKSRGDVEVWILRHQLNRRNLLKPEDFRRVLGELYSKLKGGHGGDRRSNNRPGSAAKTLSEEFGVSPSQVRAAGKRVELLEKLSKPLQTAIKNFGGAVSDAALRAMSEADTNKQSQIARLVRTGSSLAEAIAEQGLKVPRARGQAETVEHAPTASGCPCDVRLTCEVCGEKYCEHCHPDHEATCRAAQEDAEEEQAKAASAPSEAALKKARAAIGVLARFCQDQGMYAKASHALGVLTKLVG